MSDTKKQPNTTIGEKGNTETLVAEMVAARWAGDHDLERESRSRLLRYCRNKRGRIMSNNPLHFTMAMYPREAAEALGISESSLWSLTKAGEVPYTRLGRFVLYPVDELRKWLDTRASEGSNHADNA